MSLQRVTYDGETLIEIRLTHI